MRVSPTLWAVLLATSGTGALALLEPGLPPARFTPALIGAAAVLLATSALLGALRRRDRLAIAGGAAALGFFAGAAAGSGAHPWPFGYGGAWLPALLLFVGGVGRERLAHELERLEIEADDVAARPAALRRAQEIRSEARAAARALDPEGRGAPAHPGDPRALYAYAAQVAAYALAKDGHHRQAAAALGDVPAAWMPAAMRALMLSNLSFLHLCARDVAAAREALAGAREEEGPAEARPALRAARAAVMAFGGEPEAALEIVGHEDRERGEPARVRQRYRVIRAHALAAQGDLAGARAELGRVIEDGEYEELTRWIPAGGPAAALIEELVPGGAEPR